MSKFRFKINKNEEPEKKPNTRPEEGDGESANELLRELLVSLGEDLPAEEEAESADEALSEALPEISPEETGDETLPEGEEAPIRLYTSEEDLPEESLPEIPQTPETPETAEKPSIPAGKYGAYYHFSVRRPDRSLPPPAPDPEALAESIRGAEAYVSDLEDRQKEEARQAKKQESGTLPEVPAEIPEYGDTDPALHTSTAETPAAEAPFEIPEGYDEAPSSGSGDTGSGNSGEFREISRLAKEAMAKENGETEKAEDGEKPEETPSALSGLDEVDVNLMEIFGMSGELREKLGTEEFEKLHRDDGEKTEKLARKEYESPEQNKEFLAGYRRRFLGTTVRLGLALVCTLLAFLFEGMKGTLLSDLATDNSLLIYMLMMLQLTLALGACAGKEIVRGIRYLFRGKALPELVLCTAVLCNLVYELVLLGTQRLYGMRTYNLPLAVCAVAAILYTKLNERRELMAFRVISSKKKKFVITHGNSGESSLEKTAFREYIDENDEIFGVGRTHFVEDFVRRSETPGTLSGVLGILLPAALIAAAVFFALGYYRAGGSSFSENLATAMSASQVCLSFLLPSCSFAVYALPFYKAATESYRADAAIVGDAAFEEYADAAVISFNDEEVFPEGNVRTRSMRLYGKQRIDTVLYRLSSVFAKLGGPLNVVFSSATKDLGVSEDTEIIEVSKNGVDAAVDGKEVLVGSAAYMRARGLEPVIAEGDEALEYRGQICILYVAVAGVLAAKLYVEYRMDADFESIVKALYKSGMCIGIRTLDPCIDDVMLDRRIKLSKYPVRVLKSEQKGALRTVSAKASSGVVSKKSVKSLLKALTYCDRTVQVTKISAAVKILSMLGGLAIAILLFIFGKGQGLNSLYAALYQLLWMVPIGLLSYFLV